MKTGNPRCPLPFVILIGLGLVLSGCALAEKSSEPGPSETGVVSFFLKDAPADRVVAFRINAVGATIADPSGQSISISGAEVELRHLELAPTLLARTKSATSGDYSTLTLILANPRLTLSDAQGNITRVDASSTSSVRMARSGISVPLTVSVPVGGHVEIMVDVDLQQSIKIDTAGNFVIDPVVKAAVINSSSAEGELEDVLGMITAIPASSANSFDVRLLESGQTVRLLTDSNTVFSSDLGQFSGLSAGQAIELGAQLQNDGTFLAKSIASSITDAASRYQGLVTRVGATSPSSFSLEVVVQR